MIELYATLLPIALIDSLSVVPVAVLPMILLLGGKRPVLGTLAFIGGIVCTYFPFGVLLLFGLDVLFDRLANILTQWWYSEPDLGEVVLQILVGLIMIVFGHRICARGRKTDKNNKTFNGLTPRTAFTLAAVINLTGMWGALPYFAAIAQILKEDLSPPGMLSALIWYNFVFILPLVSFLILRIILGSRSEHVLQTTAELIIRWGTRALTTLLIGLGFLLLADGVGYLVGHPLLMPGAPG